MKRFVTVLLAVSLPTNVAADPITEAEFLALLTDAHPAVVALASELAEAEGERKEPRTPNPDFSFEREAPGDAASQSTFSLSWRPPLDGRRGLANDAAEAGVAAARDRLEWARLELHTNSRELFARWSLDVERRDLFVDVTSRIDALAARARARAATGEDSGLNARRLELAAAETRGALARSEVDVLEVRAEIRALHPSLDVSRIPVRPSLPAIPPALDPDRRADLRASELELERAELSQRLAGRSLEFPTLFGGWTVLDEEGQRLDGPVFGLEWNVPLFDRRQGERARTTREVESARARLELQRARAEAELVAAAQAYERLRAAAGELMKTTEGTAAVLEASSAEFQAGESTLTDLLETVRSVGDSRLAALELYQEALAAHRRLELGAGRPLAEGGPR